MNAASADTRTLSEWAAQHGSTPILAASSSTSHHRGTSTSIAFIPIGTTVTILPNRRVRIEAGRYVAAGDRFEVIRPGYQVVRDQMAAPRRDVGILGLSLSADRRTIIIRVPRQTEPVGYAVTLPLPESWRQESAIPQKPEMDVLVTLNGVRAEYHYLSFTGGKPTVVLPNASPAVSKKLTTGSTDHEAFFKHAGTLPVKDYGLSLEAEFDRSDPFQPVIQEGAALDWKPESELTLVAWSADHDSCDVWFKEGTGSLDLRTGPTLSIPLPEMNSAYFEMGIPMQGVPLTSSRTWLAWADRSKSAAREHIQKSRELLAGNWLAGRRVFFSSEAACFTCHQIRGEGIAVGPDLTNLIHRDRESVLADILQPSATINPDHPASTVKLKSGATLTGIVRHANDKELKVALQAGAVQTLAAADVASTELLKTSLMPEGYAERLTLEQQQDLIKFLLQNPLEPAPVERAEPAPPPARKRAEVEGILHRAYRSNKSSTTYPPLKILLAAGPKDHGPGEHDYPLWQKRWSTLLALAPGVSVDTSWEFPKPEQLAAADVTVFYSKNPGFNPRTAMLLDDYQNRGGGLVYLHWALNGDEHADILAERIGLAGGRTGVAFRHGEFDLVFPQPEHPVTKGFPTLHFTDETYWKLVGDPARINLLGTGVEEGAPQPQLWSMERGKGRVIGCVPGHYTWTFDDPLYRALVLRAICWTAKQENVDRLAELATVGARIAP